ncbi:Ldh family oxidoreductase [Mycobacterium sp. 94-17]|uniref:Ldh family oxidoreductase n=1 Tax=Mycobacterium sp. 94-17 TaxID=2986147 RepID=UPI002D1E7308|nr:Ldh family oxidoreductase [Mycobacterium sp. 94-17]MEB4209719.1 Ldh family oxidoreductase [Mycobacterium sp. 94-17]
MTVASLTLVEPDKLRDFAVSVLTDLGCPPEHAQIAAEAMVRTDLRGTHTHGIYYLPTYAKMLQAGGINPTPNLQVVQETTASAVLDADAALGSVATVRACDIAAEKARANGVALVLIRNTNHFGAAGYYTLRLAEQGFVALAAANGGPIMAPPGAGARLISNQPTSWAAPDPDGRGPVVLDMALSRGAGTKIMQLATRGEPIPGNWMVGPDGNPTSDPSVLATGGALLPIGDHKGWGLAVLVEVLAGVLAGAGITQECRIHNFDPDKPSGAGAWVLAIDIASFLSVETFRERLSQLRREVDDAPTAPGASVMLPGDIEARREREAAENGLALDPSIWEPLATFAESVGRRDDLERAVRS